MIAACGLRQRRYLTADQLEDYAFRTGRPIEVDSTAGLSIVKASSGIELCAPIGEVA